jgi:hypothetical protein
MSDPVNRKAALLAANAMTAIGASAVIAGGLVAAVTEPLGLNEGSWLAAYLVLVVGTGQYAMGFAHRQCRDQLVRQSRGWTQLGCWNLGSAAVIAGVIANQRLLVDAGSILLACALYMTWTVCRTLPPPGVARPWAARLWAARLWGVSYRALLVVLAISIPAGVALSHIRPV